MTALDEVDVTTRSVESWKSIGPGHWLVSGWQQAFRKVVEISGGALSSLEATVVDVSAWRDWPDPIWCRLDLETIPSVGVSVGCPAPAVQALAGLLAAGMRLSEQESRGSFFELVNQIASGAADAVSARMGKRVSFSAAQVSAIPSELDHAIQLEFALDGGSYLMALAPAAALVDAQPPTPATAQASAIPAVTTSTAVAAPTGNLDLLLEVELPVSVTFGRTQLALKDVLKLSSGSIVELNRLANEPVEVVINNCVIARGEVVVVDGNYGIRVTEIVSRQERIRSIF